MGPGANSSLPPRAWRRPVATALGLARKLPPRPFGRFAPGRLIDVAPMAPSENSAASPHRAAAARGKGARRQGDTAWP